MYICISIYVNTLKEFLTPVHEQPTRLDDDGYVNAVCTRNQYCTMLN